MTPHPIMDAFRFKTLQRGQEAAIGRVMLEYVRARSIAQKFEDEEQQEISCRAQQRLIAKSQKQRRDGAVVAFIKANPGLTYPELGEALKLSKARIEDVCQSLRHQGLVKTVMTGSHATRRARVYVVEPVASPSPWAADLPPLVRL